MKKLFSFIALVVFAATVAGCETVKGVGRDITGASDSVQKSFSKNK